MKTREEAVTFGLTFPDAYIECPFRRSELAADPGEGQ